MIKAREILFVVDTAGRCTQRPWHEGAAVARAMRTLVDDGVDPDKAAALSIAAGRTGDRDPEAFAAHLLRLRQAWDDAPGGRQ